MLPHAHQKFHVASYVPRQLNFRFEPNPHLRGVQGSLQPLRRSRNMNFAWEVLRGWGNIQGRCHKRGARSSRMQVPTVGRTEECLSDTLHPYTRLRSASRNLSDSKVNTVLLNTRVRRLERLVYVCSRHCSSVSKRWAARVYVFPPLSSSLLYVCRLVHLASLRRR